MLKNEIKISIISEDSEVKIPSETNEKQERDDIKENKKVRIFKGIFESGLN